VVAQSEPLFSTAIEIVSRGVWLDMHQASIGIRGESFTFGQHMSLNSARFWWGCLRCYGIATEVDLLIPYPLADLENKVVDGLVGTATDFRHGEKPKI